MAAYFGSLERVLPGEDDTLSHSMHQGRIDFKYELLVDGTPQPGDTRPGRLQLFNHCCEPGNNAVCEEVFCSVTGLIFGPSMISSLMSRSGSRIRNRLSSTECKYILQIAFGSEQQPFLV